MSLSAGDRFGFYEILARLGAGGMGEVYRARDTKLGREVAIKVLPAAFAADETASGRLLREARIASTLNHPNICTIYEVGEAEGQIYIAMELVEGRPLSAALGDQALPTETAIRYGVQMADALAHAHERGVVHRDLKSANVVITRAGRPKVLDFGLAKRLPAGDPEVTRTLELTQTGAVSGTLHYMAPELLRGEPADARSDVWALGVVLYEMLARELPFKGQTGFEISAAILREPIKPLRSHTPAALSAIVRRCLSKEPGERYQGASEVRAALETLLPGGATPEPLLVGFSRRRWLWAAGGVAGLGALAVAWRFVPASVCRSPAGRSLGTGGPPSKNSEANEYFEKAMLFLRVQNDPPRGQQMLERSLELDPHFAEARRWHGFAYILMILEGHSNDTGLLYEAEKDVRRASEDDPRLASVHSALAYIYLLQGRKDLIPIEVEQGLKAAPENTDALMALLQYHRLNGDTTAGLALAKRMLEREPLFYPARMTLGNLLQMQGDIAGATHEEEKVLEQAPSSIAGIFYLSLAYLDSGELAKARTILQRGLLLHAENYWVRAAWALLLAVEGKRDEAFKAMDAEVLKFAAANVFVTLEAAEFYAVLGETGKALEWLEKDVRNGDERADWFQRDRFLANIRQDPRFQQILDSITLRRSQRRKQ